MSRRISRLLLLGIFVVAGSATAIAFQQHYLARLLGRFSISQEVEVRCLWESGAVNVPGNQYARVPFRVTNLGRSTIRLNGRGVSPSVFLEGLPEALGPEQASDFCLLIHPTPYHGYQEFLALVSTDSAVNPSFALPFKLFIQADEVPAYHMLGLLPGGCHITRVIRLSNLPTQDLIRVEAPPGWSLVPKTKGGRDLELTLGGQTAALKAGQSRRSWEAQARLFFRSDELRVLKLGLMGTIVPEWEVPELILVNPFTAKDGRTSFALVRRSCENDDFTGLVKIEGCSPPSIGCEILSLSEEKRQDGLREEKFAVRAWLKPSGHVDGGSLRIALVGKDGETHRSIRIKVSGF